MTSCEPFLNVTSTDHSCSICGIVIPSSSLLKKGIKYRKDLRTIKEQADEWKNLNVPENDIYNCFVSAFDRLTDKYDGYFHENCIANLRTKRSKYKPLPLIPIEPISDEEQNPNPTKLDSRSTRSAITLPFEKRHCFICNQQKKECTSRISQDSVVDQVREAMVHHLKIPNDMHYAAAKRLDLMLKGTVVDIFAADICYHKSCFRSFTYKKKSNELDPAVEFVRNHFRNCIALKIIKQKQAYLLHELLNDAISLSEEYSVDSIFNNTKSLRRFLEEKFDNLGYHKIGKYVVVYSSDVDPIMYCESALKGHGLRKNDIMTSFAKMIHRAVDDYVDNDHIEWPSTVDDLITSFAGDRPLTELYNTIYMTMNRKWKSSIKLNENGLAQVSSKNTATKIWSIASDWTALITGLKNSKQISLGLDINRLTANKEVGNLLWKAGHTISPNDVRIQNEEFMSASGDIRGVLSGLKMRTPTHSSLDNNDQCQDTNTGKNTTHHTNFLIFQPNPQSEENTVTVNTDRSICEDISRTETQFKIGKLVPPPRLPNYKDNESYDLIEQCFKEDFLWSLAGGVPSDTENPLPLLGSWTAYKKVVCDETTARSLLNYLPANENPPEHSVCKQYLEYMVEVMGCLDINRIFVHADEQVYARIVQLIWKFKDKFQNIIPIMGGFHQLRVFQRILFKRHAVMGYGDWYWDAGIIAEGSALAAIEGRHYYRSMRVHKEGFDALTQHHIEEMTDGYEDIDKNLLISLKDLRRKPERYLVNKILESAEFKRLFEQFVVVSDTRAEMTMQYLRDVSLMLSIVSAVREGCFERHLQAERQFLKLAFAFDHVNYSRYNTYQHVFLTNMYNENEDAIIDLKSHGFGCTTSDAAKFAAKHGDLETEHFNRETKGVAGPFRSGYSANIHAVNRWIKITHSHAKLRKAVKSQFRIFTSSIHKELTPKNKKIHFDHVQALKKKLRDYNTEPFLPGPARNIVTGREIDQIVIKSLLDAPEKGNRQYKKFVNDVFVSGNKTIFETISKNKIQTGMEKTKKKCKKVDVLEEDKKAFGLIILKCQSTEEGFSFPMTYFPLSIAKSEDILYSSDKSKFRNELIGHSFASTPISNAVWIIDAGYAIRQVTPKQTYRDYFIDLLNWMIPDSKHFPKRLVICVDVYFPQSTKDGERKERRMGKEEGKRVHVSGFDQIMPKGKTKWSEFLSNGQNKNDLMMCFEQFLLTDENRTKFNTLEVIFCSSEKIWSMKEGVVIEVGLCNHEEADTKVVLFACQSCNNVVAVASDCDVLVLLITLYAKTRPENQWQMNYQSDKFANIPDICAALGYDVAKYIIHFHGISGCDDVSYFYGKGKVSPFKKAIYNSHLDLLAGLGQELCLSTKDIDNCKEFIRNVIYQGNSNESYVQTRMNLYDKQSARNKTTMTIPPDEDSCTQHILRCHHRVYIWTRCDHSIIPTIDKFKNGWKLSEDGMVVPVWYKGPQLPPSCKKKCRKEALGGYEADVEPDVDESQICKRKRRKVRSIEEGTLEKKTKVETFDKGKKFRMTVQTIVNEIEESDDGSTIDLLSENINVSDYVASNEEDVNEDSEVSEWEHLYDFEFNSDSSGSDWM